MTWQEALLRDLGNVQTGYQEAGKDTTLVDDAVAFISNETTHDAVIEKLVACQLKTFAELVFTGNYDRIVEAQEAEENGTDTDGDSTGDSANAGTAN